MLIILYRHCTSMKFIPNQSSEKIRSLPGHKLINVPCYSAQTIYLLINHALCTVMMDYSPSEHCCPLMLISACEPFAGDKTLADLHMHGSPFMSTRTNQFNMYKSFSIIQLHCSCHSIFIKSISYMSDLLKNRVAHYKIYKYINYVSAKD